uniref:Uncharacterized protein n=1 Tax=Aegilops tauschii subsp. strangulata TaxID=200361 RepID=A0A453E2E8_AEGTS
EGEAEMSPGPPHRHHRGAPWNQTPDTWLPTAGLPLCSLPPTPTAADSCLWPRASEVRLVDGTPVHDSRPPDASGDPSLRPRRRRPERETGARRQSGGAGEIGRRELGEGGANHSSSRRRGGARCVRVCTALQSAMVMDTTDPGYWLNWRFLLCATWVYSCMALACYLIWKYEGPSSPAGNEEGVDREEARPKIGPGVVYLEDCWKPCLEEIHPAWLLAFRLVSFLFMASVLVSDVIVDGWTVFLYYTQWTFLLVTLYFGLGSVLSIYGCYRYACKTDKSDGDHGSYIIAPTGESTYDDSIKRSCFNKTHDGREIAGFWGYLFQIMFQTNAGAVMLTDMVFWFILYPFLARNQYQMNFLLIGTHSLNALFIIGDTALNSLVNVLCLNISIHTTIF